MKVAVKILPRNEVLDSQGRTVEKTLNSHNYPVSNCRVGKYIELEVEASSAEEAQQKVKAMAEFILFNPMTESYQLEVL